MDLNIHSLIWLHGVVLNWLSTGTQGQSQLKMTGIELFYFLYTLYIRYKNQDNIIELEALTACHVVC
jgi:hypothetical protein